MRHYPGLARDLFGGVALVQRECHTKEGTWLLQGVCAGLQHAQGT